MDLGGSLNLRDQVSGIGGRLLYWEYAERVRKSMKWNVLSVSSLRNAYHRKAAVICGGGPSIRQCLPQIRELQRQGGYVITVNKTHDYFLNLDEPIIPFAHVVLDPMPWVADYVKKPNPGTKYLISSQCDPSVMRRLRLAGAECYLWHAGANFYNVAMPTPILEEEFSNKPWGVVYGATTVGLRAVPLGYDLGFRPFHLFGFDSSMTMIGGKFNLHAYDKPRPKDSTEGTVTLKTKMGEYHFYTNNHMGRQAIDFEDLCEQAGEHVRKGFWEPIDIRVYGDGLLPSYAASIGLHGDPEKNLEFCGRRDAA